MRYTRVMLLFLVRHALTSMTGKKLSGWLPGISLSPEGVKQAEHVAGRMKDLPLKAVYSSPLERCAETAEQIAANHDLRVQVVEGLGEIRYGDWQGKTMTSLYKSKLWSELKARPGDFRFPNGETVREAQTRGMATVERLRPLHKGQAIAVCSHADLIRLLVAGYTGLSIDLYDRITIAPASVTTLLLMPGGTPRLLKLSDTGDFADVMQRLSAVNGSAKAARGKAKR